MASQRLKRTMREALAAGAVIVAISTAAPNPASADPTTNDPTAQYQQLSQQLDTLNEQLNNAMVDLKNKQAALDKANADLAAAKTQVAAAQAKEDQYRGSVDQLAAASFEGARMDQLSALLTGSSAKDFLDRATYLQNLADDSARVLATFQGAIDQASAAEARAASDQKTSQDATNAANALVNQIQQQKQAVQNQANQVQQALSRLSASARASLSGGGISGVFIGPPGIRGEAMQAALSRRGDPYEWGAAGPNAFDCSGLVMWAYEQYGVSLPHSAAQQQQMGQSISRADLQPGDLVFYGDPAHHVGIYVGNGLMVDAPTEGQDVKVEPLESDYSGARRLTG